MLEEVYQASPPGAAHPGDVEDPYPGPRGEVDPEDELEYEPEPEDRHAEPQERQEGPGVVQQAVFLYRRVHAEGYGDDRGDDQGAPDQEERRENPIAYDLAYGSVLLETHPQV